MTAPGRTLLMLGVMLFGAPASAYRPFDSTDADLVVNAGLHPRLELVLEGRGLVSLERSPEHRYRIVDTALLAKLLARRGSLQGEAYARDDGSDTREIRAGLSWSFRAWGAGP